MLKLAPLPALACLFPPCPALQGLSSNSRYQIVFGLERIMDEVLLPVPLLVSLRYCRPVLLRLLQQYRWPAPLPVRACFCSLGCASYGPHPIRPAHLPVTACRPPTCALQTIARRIPAAAYFTTLAIRFANNVVGGENFIDMARWAGVQ